MKEHPEPPRTSVRNWMKRLRRYGKPRIEVRAPERYKNKRRSK